MSNHNLPLSEMLRPVEFADLIVPEKLRHALEAMALKASIQNMTFYGKPGLGKTSAARILIKKGDFDVIEKWIDEPRQ